MKTLRTALSVCLLTLLAGVACASSSKYEKCLEAAANDAEQIEVCKAEERERVKQAEERRRERHASPPATSGQRPGGSY